MTAQPHNPCATCGTCCRSYLVPVYGYDIWRLCTRQHLSPEDFVVVIPDPIAKTDSFRLRRDGEYFSLALDKQGRFRKNGPCIFLVHLTGNHDRCGVYPDRPVVCQTYPMRMQNGVVVQRGDSLCPSNSWPPEELARPGWRTALLRLKVHVNIYHEVVARWNAWIATIQPDLQYSPSHFLDYLLNVYDRIAAIDREFGEESLREIHASWGTLPASFKAGTKIRATPDGLPWLHYLGEVRSAIDSFFKEVPPLSISLPIAREEQSSE